MSCQCLFSKFIFNIRLSDHFFVRLTYTFGGGVSGAWDKQVRGGVKKRERGVWQRGRRATDAAIFLARIVRVP